MVNPVGTSEERTVERLNHAASTAWVLAMANPWVVYGMRWVEGEILSCLFYFSSTAYYKVFLC